MTDRKTKSYNSNLELSILNKPIVLAKSTGTIIMIALLSWSEVQAKTFLNIVHPLLATFEQH